MGCIVCSSCYNSEIRLKIVCGDRLPGQFSQQVNYHGCVFYKLPIDLQRHSVLPFLSLRDYVWLDTALGSQDGLTSHLHLLMAKETVYAKKSNARAIADWFYSRRLSPYRVIFTTKVPSYSAALVSWMMSDTKELVIRGYQPKLPRTVRYDLISNLTLLDIRDFFAEKQALRKLLRGNLLLQEVHLFNGYAVLAELTQLPQLHTLGLYFCPPLTPQLVKRVLLGCPSLHSLTLRYLYNRIPLRVPIVEWTARWMGGLRSLSLLHCSHLYDTDLLALAQHCPNLTSCDISTNTIFTDITYEGVATLVKGLPLLQVLGLNERKTLTDECVLALALHCQQLRILRIDGCVLITAEALCVLARYCPALEEVHCERCTAITAEGIGQLAAAHPHLRLHSSYTI